MKRNISSRRSGYIDTAVIRFGLLAGIALLSACTPQRIGTPPPKLSFNGFYTQHVDAGGIPIVSSAHVSAETLLRARDIIIDMLAHRPDIALALIRADYRVAIMAEREAITDLPQNAHWTRPARGDPRLTRCERKHYDARVGAFSDREYWNARARGIGGKFTVGAEEDVLGRRSSRYWGETIFVHEFAHNVLDAIRMADPALYSEVEAAYAAALADGLWKDEYASTTVQEYWAEGSQFWFNSNRLAVFEGQRILSHDDVSAYDPRLAAVLHQAYGDRHRLQSDPFYMHSARVPPGPIPRNTAELC
ncbi:glycoside hydrolase [Sphingorhabdus sp. Alg239-R122]|uniref:glycoside hydrolase n=1 Tax=Sphingorhabdus sp. Alg239-R122 TaxID=2305989 RepID=UPI001F07AE86|nr:glycoside hydrolase [Sphingorhabdus sp. Alg239-R122]